MKKTLTAMAVVTAVAGFGFAGGTASAAADGGCVKDGLATLKSLNAIPAAAQGKVDYSAFADPDDGPIFLELAEGSNLKLKDVIRLHQTNPELFAWC